MATLQLTHSPILPQPAQLLILPVNNVGVILDPVIARCKILYPDNYHHYRKACLDAQLSVGTSLLVRRQREQSGLGVSGNSNRPSHIANLVVCDHPYHPVRRAWLSSALDELKTQLFELMRHEGLRSVALLARPLIYPNHSRDSAEEDLQSSHQRDFAEAKVPLLDWQQDILPLLEQKLADLPKLRIEIHLPKHILF